MNTSFQDFTTLIHPYKQELKNAFDRVLASDWFILGEEVASFEQEFATYTGSTYAIGVANGMEALQIALMALDIGKGDEVITTPVSAVATTLAILAVGAKPIFVDVDSNGLLLINQVETALSPQTKAVLPVHLYGNPVDVTSLKKMCSDHNLFLIEDAAQAHGSMLDNKMIGSIGDIGCFSFYPTKNLGALGDGGAIVTYSKELAQKCQVIRNYGQQSKYLHVTYGLNSRLDELQAAILRVRLHYLDEENERRRSLSKVYRAHLSKIPQLSLLSENTNAVSNIHLFVVRTQQRDQLQAYLLNEGIETLVHYPQTIPDQPLFKKKYKDLIIPEARKLCQEVLSLPCHPAMTTNQVEVICNKITTYFRKVT